MLHKEIASDPGKAYGVSTGSDTIVLLQLQDNVTGEQLRVKLDFQACSEILSDLEHAMASVIIPTMVFKENEDA